MFKKIKFIAMALLLTFSISGCKKEEIRVCTTVYPINYLVNAIAGEYVGTCSISNNEIVQRAQITEKYETLLEEADILFYIGGLEPYYDIYSSDIKNSDTKLVDLAVNSAIYPFGRYSSINIDGNEVGVEKPYYESSAFDLVNTYTIDPMIWMDPIAMTSMARTITDELRNLLPEYSFELEEKFKELEVNLARLDAEFQYLKRENKDIGIVMMSPSFGNWQKSYGVKVYPVILSKYGTLPNEQQLEVIKERIVADGIQYIALEPNLAPDMLALQQLLVEELGLISVELSNLSSLTQDEIDSNQDYFSLMYKNLETLESIAK